MKLIWRVLFLFIFLFSTAGLFTFSYAFNKLDDLESKDGSTTQSSDLFTEVEVLTEFFTELSQLGKDQLKSSVKEIAATEKDPKFEITLTIGKSLGEILEKYLSAKEEEKVKLGSASKKFPKEYMKIEIENRIEDTVTKSIVSLLEIMLQEDQEKEKDQVQLNLLKFLKANKFFRHIKESILGIIPNPAPQTFLNYIIQNDIKARGLIKKPQELLEHLKILITGDKFKIDRGSKTWVGDEEVTFKITYLGSGLKVACESTQYDNNNTECVTAQVCKKKGRFASIKDGKNVCAACPVDQANQKGTHKINANGECVKKDFIKIIESYFRDYEKAYLKNPEHFTFAIFSSKERDSENAKGTLAVRELHWFVIEKYYLGHNPKKESIKLDDGTLVTIPPNYTREYVNQYMKEKSIEFLEGILDNDPSIMNLVSKSKLLSKIVSLYVPELPEVAPANFNPETRFNKKTHNFWQYIYLEEVESFIGSDGTQLTKPSTYTKAEMTPYLKALLKESDKWGFSDVDVLFYKTEKVAECTSHDSYFYDKQCITGAECKVKGKAIYPYTTEGKHYCGLCPVDQGTHKIKNGQCVNKDFEKIMESYGKALIKKYEANENIKLGIDLTSKDKVKHITLNFYNFDLHERYFGNYYNSGAKNIELDDGTSVMVPPNYTQENVKQYVKEELLEFLEKILDDDKDIKNLYKKIPVLQDIIEPFFPNLLEQEIDNFDSNTEFDNKTHNLWQAIYLFEVESFIGSDGTEIKKPSTYTKETIPPYLKKLIKETNKWEITDKISEMQYITEKSN